MDEKLLHEIEDVMDKMDRLSKKRPYSLNNLFFQSGLFFFLIFLLSITQVGLFFGALSLLSFIVLSMGLLKTSADVFYYKKSDGFSLVLGSVLMVLVGFSYYALWSIVLVKHSLLITILLGIIILLATLFYLLHGYMSYLHNKAKNESLITALIVAANWFLLFVSIFYNNAIIYLLLLIAVLFLVKAVLDFSQHFVHQE